MELTADIRTAIHDLLVRHGHLTDDGAFDRMGEVFTDDVVYDVTDLGGGLVRGLSILRSAALALGEGNPVAHHVTNVLVEATDDPDTVRARSKGIGVTVDGTCGSVTYDDVVRRTPDGWRIVHRIVRARRTPLTP